MFLLTAGALNGQTGLVKIWVVDANGQTDTVLLGLQPAASNGVDTALGERNLFQELAAPPTLRSIQRVTADHRCLHREVFGTGTDRTSIYFDGNRDLAVDLRSATDRDSLSFELTIEVSAYPATVYADASQIGPLNRRMLVLGKNPLCEVTLIWGVLDGHTTPPQPLFHLNENLTTLVLLTDADVSSPTGIDLTPFRVYPTVVYDQLHLETPLPADDYRVSVIHSSGYPIRPPQILSADQPIPTSSWPPGLYLVCLHSRTTGNLLVARKVIKH